ncbi:uncharacterized protein LOC128553663 [Mercenaria mercenaria]|uniref:uncharacterized protein LOC128553663 n=1 Tax=Mercenaria mercenaria TaxID=6596 RepID=UPI00234EAC61|nr:uncharacterized protein LOC128553663 [Mercenaria mercenaria]
MAEAICVIEDDVSVDKATPLLASQQRSYLKEQVWEEIFQEKCAITVQQNEILHVKDNVESFVSKVIQRALNSDTYQNFISAVDKKDLIQFNEQCSEENLLQIGSFYEGTKNSYPNEFDFIFVLTEYSAKDYTLLQKLTSDLSDLFHEELKNVISGLSLKLDKVFEQFSLSGQHGPASKIKLVFKEAAALRERIVYLDISAASRWHFETCLPKEIEVCCNEWIEMILETGSALVIKVYKADHPKHKTEVKITITETEQNFVRHAMTENHRKVYRLLKYVFNGNDGANETLKMLIRRPDNTHTSSIAFIGKKVSPKIVYDLPSYTIKTLIFDHVHRCRNAEEGIAECLTEVLKSLLAKFDGTKCVSVKTMLRQPVEITDDSLSTEAVGMKLSILLKTAENVEQTREMMRAGLEKQIPFTEQQIDTVETVLTLKGCILGYSRVLLLTVPAIIGIILLTIIGISGQLCVVSPTYSSNKSIDVQYCCIGTKGISERWRNVTCSKSNIFSRHSDDIACLLGWKRRLLAWH